MKTQRFVKQKSQRLEKDCIILTIQGLHGLFGLLTRVEVDERKVAHHLHSLDVSVPRPIEMFQQGLFGRRQRQVTHVEIRHLYASSDVPVSKHNIKMKS